MINKRTPRNVFEQTHAMIEQQSKRIDDVQKQHQVPTLPAYDAKKFPPNRIANPHDQPPSGTPPPVDLGYDPNYYPNTATYGQIVRDTNNYDSLWIYQDDDKWHQMGCARCRLELSYNHPQMKINGEKIVKFDFIYNPYPGIFDSALALNGSLGDPGNLIMPYIQVGGIYATTYRLFFDVDPGPFVDTAMMTQRYEPDWNGWCGYDIFHGSIDNGVWSTIIFTIGNDVNVMWPAGGSDQASWPGGIPQYVTCWQPNGGGAYGSPPNLVSGVKDNLWLGDDAFGAAHPDYFQGSYLEIVRLGGANVQDLNVDVDTSGIYVDPDAAGPALRSSPGEARVLSEARLTDAEIRQQFEQLPSQQVRDWAIPEDELPIGVKRRREKVSPMHTIRQGG